MTIKYTKSLVLLSTLFIRCNATTPNPTPLASSHPHGVVRPGTPRPLYDEEELIPDLARDFSYEFSSDTSDDESAGIKGRYPVKKLPHHDPTSNSDTDSEELDTTDDEYFSMSEDDSESD